MPEYLSHPIEFEFPAPADLVLLPVPHSVSDVYKRQILHSDRGSNFISYTYNKYLKDHHIIHSYSRPSTPTDNAPLESFNRTLKDAILLNEAGKSYSTVRKHISKFMEDVYKRQVQNSG